MFDKTPNLEKSVENKVEFPKQAKEMIQDFKALLFSFVEKYDFVKITEDLQKLDKIELNDQLLKAKVKIETIRQKNNNPEFKKYFYEFSSVLSGAIHDIRNAINFLLNQINDGEELSLSFFNRFFSYYKKYQAKETIAEFVGQSLYMPFEKIQAEFLESFRTSFADFNYKINYSDDFEAQKEINYNSTALLLLFNELATNLKKYGEDEEINLEFSSEYWSIKVVNKVKPDLDEKTFSSHTGMKVLQKSVDLLSGEILENGVNGNIYKFIAHLSLDEE